MGERSRWTDFQAQNGKRNKTKTPRREVDEPSRMNPPSKVYGDENNGHRRWHKTTKPKEIGTQFSKPKDEEKQFRNYSENIH
jgi:hypothetical protein